MEQFWKSHNKNLYLSWPLNESSTISTVSVKDVTGAWVLDTLESPKKKRRTTDLMFFVFKDDYI